MDTELASSIHNSTVENAMISPMPAYSNHSPHSAWSAMAKARLLAARTDSSGSSEEQVRLDNELMALQAASKLLRIRRNELVPVIKLSSDVRLLFPQISVLQTGGRCAHF